MNTGSIKTFFQRLAGNRILQHVLFWTASFLFLLNYFSTSDKVEKIDVIYTALFHISLVVTVYLNLWILIPRILRKGMYLVYFLCLASAVFLFESAGTIPSIV